MPVEHDALIMPKQVNTAQEQLIAERSNSIQEPPMTQFQPTEFDFVGVRMKLLLSGTETGNQFSLLENTSSGVSQTPVHIHADDDETLYMIEGEMEAVVAGQRQVVQAGKTVFLPRGVPHQLMNASGRPTRYLLLCTPAGFENFVAEAGQIRPPGSQPHPPSPEDIARLRHAAPRFGITLLPGWSDSGQRNRDHSYG